MQLSELKGKKIAVWGFGVEGKATAEYLSRNGLNFTVLAKKSETLQNDFDYSFQYCKVDSELLNQYDVIVKSPGISPYQKLVEQSKAKFISATALWFANEKNNKVIAISGTKGKSTVSSMMAQVLTDLGVKNQLVGNIGEPLLSVQQDQQWVVFECSSYQTYDGQIQADIGVITNLFPEHLNWHLSLENYFKDKLKLLQGSEIRVMNQSIKSTVENTLSQCGQSVQSIHEHFYCFNDKRGFCVDGEILKYQQTDLMSLSEAQVLGAHNLQNMAAVLTVCQCLELNINACVKSLKCFQPLQHRLQNLGKIGRHYAINDSISSTPHASIAAIKSLNNLHKTTLLLGGFDRKVPWDEFAQFIKGQKLCSILISGDNADFIFASMKPLIAQQTLIIEKHADLQKAIDRAVELTPDNGTILLSPGSPSFDAFKNYIERGEFFVKELENIHTADS